MEIATEHAEGERVAAGEAVKERLLLGGIALQCGDVAGGDQERAVAVEADFADPPAGGLDEATVPAREAAHRAVRELLDQLAFPDAGVEHLRERSGTAVRGVVRQERGDAAVGHTPYRTLPGVS